MSARNIVHSTRALMMRGKRFSPKEIERYEAAIRQHVDNTRVETIFLLFAEALHDEYGFGMKRISNVMNKVEDGMREWLSSDFDMDDMRIRAFEKTRFIFTCDEEERKRVYELLRAAGYDVRT